VQLFDVDDTTLIDPQAGSGVFGNGVVKYSVPAGHYFAIAEFGGSGRTPGNRFVIVPQFSVTGNRTVTIRGEPHTVLQAINRQIAHYAQHIGQIVFLAKHLRSGEWKTLSIPRGKSEDYKTAPPQTYKPLS